MHEEMPTFNQLARLVQDYDLYGMEKDGEVSFNLFRDVFILGVLAERDLQEATNDA